MNIADLAHLDWQAAGSALAFVGMGGLGFKFGPKGNQPWFKDAKYADLSVLADFNNDRYALPALGLEQNPDPNFANGVGVYVSNTGGTLTGSPGSITGTIPSGQTGVTIERGTFSGLIPGALYAFSVTGNRGTAPNMGIQVMNPNAGYAVVSGASPTFGTTPSTQSIYFTCPAGGQVYPQLFASGVAGQTIQATQFSIKEIQLPYGEERVTNGTFALDPFNATADTVQNGWAWRLQGGTSAQAWTGSAITLTGDGANNIIAYTSFATTIGALYQLNLDVTGSACIISVGTVATNQASLAATSGTTAGQTYVFVATATTTFVSLSKSGAATATIDNVSVREIRNSTLGANLVANGDFSSSTGWTLGSGCTISGGVLNIGAGAGYAEYPVTTSAGGIYRVTATAAGNSVFCGAWDGAGQAGALQGTPSSRSGTFTFYFIANDASSFIGFTATGAGALTVDNVSVQLVTPAAPKRSATFNEVFAYSAADTQAGQRTFIDSTGQLAYLPNNLALWSNDFSNAVWGALGGTATATANQITFNGGAGDWRYQTISLPVGAKYIASATVSAGTKTGKVAFFNANSSAGVVINLTSTPTRYYFVGTVGATSENIGFDNRVGPGSDGVTGTINVSNLQVELVTYQTSPGAYIATTSAADTGANKRRLTYANGKRQLRLEDARTNLTFPSTPRSTETWAYQNNATTTDAAGMGLDGGNALLVTTTGSNATTMRSVIHTAAQHAVTFWIKPGNVSSNISLGMGDSASTNGAAVVVNLTARTFTGGATGTGAFASCTIDPVNSLGYYRVVVVCTPSAANGRIFWNTPTVGGTFYVGAVQVELGAFASDLIPTTSGTVQRQVETARLSPLVEAILQRTAASVVVQGRLSYKPSLVSSANVGRILGTANATDIMEPGSSSDTAIGSWNGTAAIAATLGGGTTIDQPWGIAAAKDATGRLVLGNGFTPGSDLNGWGDTSQIYLARSAQLTANPGYGHGHYDALMVAPTRLSLSRLQQLAVAA